MYCSNCGTPVTSGLTFCNRCGARLEEKSEPIKTVPITAFLTAITLIGICGLAIMFGGSLVLRNGAGLPIDLVAVFMLFTFLTVVYGVHVFQKPLQTDRLEGAEAEFTPAQQPPLELRSPSAQHLPNQSAASPRTQLAR